MCVWSRRIVRGQLRHSHSSIPPITATNRQGVKMVNVVDETRSCKVMLCTCSSEYTGEGYIHSRCPWGDA
jgi:hypothetical protein